MTTPLINTIEIVIETNKIINIIAYALIYECMHPEILHINRTKKQVNEGKLTDGGETSTLISYFIVIDDDNNGPLVAQKFPAKAEITLTILM